MVGINILKLRGDTSQELCKGRKEKEQQAKAITLNAPGMERADK